MKKQNAYKRIRQSMRQNEIEVLAYLRKNKVELGGAWNFGDAWDSALRRLSMNRRVYLSRPHGAYNLRYYIARKGARPVTAAVR